MSDEKEHRRPDETSEFSPFDDEGEVRPKDGHPQGEDATRMMPPAADDDATRVTPQPSGSDATSVLPASGTHTERYDRSSDTWADDAGPVWAGRAGVRPPRPGSGDDFAPSDWTTAHLDEPRGKWWMPIVVGIVGLVLLGLLTWGIYLIATSSGGDTDTTPEVTTSAVRPENTGTGGTPPTIAPTTTPPQSSAVATASDVTIPALVGLSADEARAALDRKGMNYRLRFVTADAPAGTVIESDPAEGQQVPPDTVVTLIIAQPPASSAPPDTPSPSQSTPTEQPGGN